MNKHLIHLCKNEMVIHLCKNEMVLLDHIKLLSNKFKIDIDLTKFAKIYENLYLMLNNARNIKLISRTNVDTNHVYTKIYSKFISDKIRKHILELDKCELFKYKNVTISFLYKDKLDINIKNKLVNHIAVISEWFYNINPIKKIKIIYCDIQLKKKLNLKTKILSNDNVNSGLSTNNQIICWRREELTKVLIHELLHYLDIDFKGVVLDSIINYNIGNYPIILNEAITELYAQFFHSIYITTNISQLEAIYKYEIIFDWYQFTKLMKYYNINVFSKSELEKKFLQTTNVFSYYIIKTILTTNIIDLIMMNSIINKNVSMCNVNKCDKLVKLLHNILTHTNKHLITKLFNKITILNNDYSLRMTLFSIF